MPDTSYPDPDVRALASVLAQLNNESDELNRIISSYNDALVSLAPGFSLWLDTPLRVRPSTSGKLHYASQIGFGKAGDKWGLRLRRGKFRLDDEKALTPTGEWDTDVPLLEASREDRADALPALKELIRDMTEVAQYRLEKVREAKKSVR